MSTSTQAAPAQTKIFGIRIGVNPKVLAGVLIALALVLLWYNTRSDEEAPPSSTTVRRDAAAPITPVRPSAIARVRRTQNLNDHGLRLRPIDPTRGDVDPTLRLDLIARLQNVQPAEPGRSLFEVGPPPLTPAQEAILKHPPAVQPKAPVAPGPVAPTNPADLPLSVPLKYYGFVKSAEKSQGNRGLFLDGDNIVVGAEGETVLKKYLIVSLTPTTARLEDPQLKKGQTLLVVPAAAAP